MADRWIVIPNWRRFQHYRDRNPKWIKVYTELMSDDAFLALSFHQRGVLISLWLEYAAGRRQIVDNTATVSRRLGGRVTRATLDALNDAGFIEVSASSPLAKPEHPASPELLRNSNSGDDRASAIASSRQQLLTAAGRFADEWNGGSSDAFDAGLDELEQLAGARLKASDRYQLWDQALHHEGQLH